jgi:endonuclease I
MVERNADEDFLGPDSAVFRSVERQGARACELWHAKQHAASELSAYPEKVWAEKQRAFREEAELLVLMWAWGSGRWQEPGEEVKNQQNSEEKETSARHEF